MKKLLIYPAAILLFCAICLGIVIPVSAECTDANMATISGRGVLYVPADTATLSFSIETRADILSDSKKQNSDIIKNIESAVSKFGHLNEESVYSYSDPSSGKYTVTRCMTLSIGKIDMIDEITQKLTDNGVSGINYICYQVKDLRPYQDKVLCMAIEDAKSKVTVLGLNLTLSAVNEYGCSGYYDGKCDKDGNKLISIECNVSVIFERKN